MINSITAEIDFSNENIYKLNNLIKGKEVKMHPNYYNKICGTTGLIIFFIKDVLDYCGILTDSKKTPYRIYTNCLHVFEALNKKKTKIKQISKDLNIDIF